MAYIWAYVDGQDYDPVCDEDWTEDSTPVILPVSYAVDLWGDNHEHGRMSEYAKTTSDSQVYKQARMFEHDIWEFDPYFRACRQLPGGYGAHTSWKKNRKHQYRPVYGLV